MEKMKRTRADVILLDLMMPRMDGLTFLRKIMVEDPIPVVVCSALTGQGSDAALRALDEGAVDVVAKPRIGVADFLEESAETLIDTLFAATRARLRPRGIQNCRGAERRPAAQGAAKKRNPGPASGKVIAVGASTGGPAALRILLYHLTPDSPGLVIVQHMPEVFTEALARRLDSGSQLDVKEAEDGDLVLRGRALIAPGNRHMRLRHRAGQYYVQISDGPRVGRHRPSVDVLFSSVAGCAGKDAVGVLLTGMGSDGAEGLYEMKLAGAQCLAQDEQTSVVFGMPKQAIARGAVENGLPLSKIPESILKAAAGKR
jgi:two-component system chemotaxis response regulator CheB